MLAQSERINPGDKDRTLRKIVKVVAGDTTATLKKLSELYENYRRRYP